MAAVSSVFLPFLAALCMLAPAVDALAVGPNLAQAQTRARLEHRDGERSSDRSDTAWDGLVPPMGPVPPQPPAYEVAAARAALATPEPPVPTGWPWDPRRSNAAFPTGVPPVGWWLYTTTTTIAPEEDCINNPSGCTCQEAIGQCREEAYMCEESMKELQRVIPGVYEENYQSKFDHPLVNTLAVHAEVKLRGRRVVSEEVAANVLCTEDEKQARDDCFSYFHACYRNQERLSQWYRNNKAEILSIDSAPLKL